MAVRLRTYADFTFRSGSPEMELKRLGRAVHRSAKEGVSYRSVMKEVIIPLVAHDLYPGGRVPEEKWPQVRQVAIDVRTYSRGVLGPTLGWGDLTGHGFLRRDDYRTAQEYEVRETSRAIGVANMRAAMAAGRVNRSALDNDQRAEQERRYDAWNGFQALLEQSRANDEAIIAIEKERTLKVVR